MTNSSPYGSPARGPQSWPPVPSGFNDGRWLAAPTQSPYATVRQFILANPGFVPERLSRLLRQGCNVHVSEHYHPIKHCSSCARAWYHSNYYDERWLVRCPIHGGALLDLCPACSKPWPRIADFRTRQCAVCGIPPWHALPSQGLTHQAVAPIMQIDALLEEGARRYGTLPRELAIADLAGSYAWDSFARQHWHQAINRNSTLFPMFVAHRSRRFNQQDLKNLGVYMPQLPLREIKTHLRAFPLKTPRPGIWHRHYDTRQRSSGRARRQPSRRALSTTLGCLREIVEWIDSHAGPSHRLGLIDFRTLSFGSLQERAWRPCPFCLSFAAWWDAITQKFFHPDFCSTPASYWFTQDLRCAQWPDTSERQVIVDADNAAWRAERSFESWFHARGLLLLFAYLFEWAVFLVQRLEATSSAKFDWWDQRNHFLQPDYSCAYYLQSPPEASRTITMLWADSNPLDEITLPDFPPAGEARVHPWIGEALRETSKTVDVLLRKLTQGRPVDLGEFRAMFLEIGKGYHQHEPSPPWRKHEWGLLDPNPAPYQFRPAYLRWR